MKYKISVNNKLKGSLGQMDPKTNKIEINVRAHKRRGRVDKAELASTIKHEMMHVKHPKMTEKQVYKRTAKTKIGPQERAQLLAKLYKVDSSEPGAIYEKANEGPVKKVSIAGLV